MGEPIDSLYFYKCSEPVKPKSKLGTKTGLAEEGGITIGSATIGGTTTRILIFKSKPRYSINELRKEESRSKDFKHQTHAER